MVGVLIVFAILYSIGLWWVFHLLYDRKISEITYIAYHDSLTGLPNRLNFKQTMIDLLHKRHPNLAVILLDLDTFKSVNDHLGHLAGDKLLTLVAERLCKSVRLGDIVFRLHGDEFAIILKDAPVSKILEINDKILAAMREPYHIYDEWLICTASFGICLVKDYEMTPRQVLREADIAMYYAKDAGKNSSAFYMSSMKDPKILNPAIDTGKSMI